MATRNLEEGFITIPSNSQPITLNFTGAAIISVNCFYAINNKTALLYIPAFSTTAIMSTGTLYTQLPDILLSTNSFGFIGSVVNASNNETQGLITIASTGQLEITANISGDMFASGSICGTYSGITLTYNRN